MSQIKEPHFFTENVVDISTDIIHSKVIKDENDYLQLFDQCATHVRYRGESSPSYFWEPDCALKITSMNPDAKIIAVLRDPIERIKSHYNMDYRSGREKHTSLMRAIKMDLNRSEKGWGKSRLYLELGHYANSLSIYQQVFGKNLLISYYEDFNKNPESFMDSLFTFLGVPSNIIHNVPTLNKGYYYGSKTKFLKKIPFRNLISKKTKEIFKKTLLSQKPSKLSNQEILFLLRQYLPDQLRLSEEFGINRYLNVWHTKYSQLMSQLE